jgi:hypothetical protein
LLLQVATQDITLDLVLVFPESLPNQNNFFFLVLEFELSAYTLSHSASSFHDGYFQDRVSGTICPGLVWNLYPPDPCLLSSWITGLSHWHPARITFNLTLPFTTFTNFMLMVFLFVCFFFCFSSAGDQTQDLLHAKQVLEPHPQPLPVILKNVSPLEFI